MYSIENPISMPRFDARPCSASQALFDTLQVNLKKILLFFYPKFEIHAIQTNQILALVLKTVLYRFQPRLLKTLSLQQLMHHRLVIHNKTHFMVQRNRPALGVHSRLDISLPTALSQLNLRSRKPWMTSSRNQTQADTIRWLLPIGYRP